MDLTTFNQELIEVDNVLSDTQFTVRRGAGGTTAATIASAQWFTLIQLGLCRRHGRPKSYHSEIRLSP